jgi:hypothetical protein
MPAPFPPALPVAVGPADGQNPTPFTGTAPFGPPSFVPANGSTVGVAQPILINFPGRVDDAGATESAIHVSSVPPVPGKFYWMTPTQLRWRPLSFWPAHTAVTVDAGGTVSSFHTGDTLVATADDATHQLTVTRNGTVEKTIPMSMGMAAGGHQTANGTYYVQEKMPSVVMDSSTYGVPVSSTYGYKVTVDLAVRSTTAATSYTALHGLWMTRVSATSVTAASTSAPPTQGGSSTTSAPVIPSS